ncbi:hypothetical protein EON82_16525 [bacterium]|nr:MAG: hypothetical protein EON82_16525 [bacterium]
MIEFPKTGEALIRTADGQRFTVVEVIDAGGENLYRVEPEGGGESFEIESGALVKGHDDDQPKFVNPNSSQ